MNNSIGKVEWADLTVPDAGRVRDFYQKVVGWKTSNLDCGGYDDFCMNLPSNGQTVAGVCHTKGANKNLPPVWLMYVNVANLNESIKWVKELGGEVVDGPRQIGDRNFCCIKDLAGAYLALYEAE
jgi:uncharacterized protein